MGYTGTLNIDKKMVRYHDLEVKIHPVSSTEYNHVDNYTDPFTSGTSGGRIVPMIIDKIIYSSDTTPTVLTGTIPDLDFAKRNVVMTEKGHTFSGDPIDKLVPGFGISVRLKTDNRGETRNYAGGDDSNEIIFKGYIGSVTRNFSQRGISYTVEARDVKSRMTYQTIKKVYNGNYKNGTMPSYRESTWSVSNSSDFVYTNEKLTVYQILNDILYYARKTSSYNGGRFNFIGFDINNFNFEGDSYLRNFVPPTLSFDNITILEAIYRLVNSAGPYRIVVKYGSSGDTIYFPRLDDRCSKCGPEIKLNYGEDNMSFNEVNVIYDNTHRKIYDAINIMKAYSAQIEWYSGHFYIKKGNLPNYYVGTGFPIDTVEEAGQGGTVTEKSVNFSCRNWDGYPYYFGIKSIPIGKNKASESAYITVGAPLYPAWNPSSGYGPFQRTYEKFREGYDTNVLASPTDGHSYSVKLNYGITENDVKFIKDRNFLDTVSRDRLQNAIGLSYVAFVPFGVCPACRGKGAVEEYSYSGEDYFGRTRDFYGNPIHPEFYSGLTPFNYNFGAVSNKDGIGRFTGSVPVPRRHPVPWLNTCPVCRGTGVEPWYRMGTILSNLVDISPDQVKLGELSRQTIGSGLQLDKTYSQISADMSYKYQPVVHIETAVDSYKAYEYNEQFVGDDLIPHPLNRYRQIAELYTTTSTISNGVNISAKVLSDSYDGSSRGYKKLEHYIHALRYTQVIEASGFSIDYDRSMVIFNNSQFIPCSAPMTNPVELPINNGSRIVTYDKEDSCFTYSSKGESDGVGQYVGSFWRAARAWITCYFKMDRLEMWMGGARDISRYTTSLGRVDSYYAAPRIEDGRYCVELTKQSGQNSENEFHIRPVSAGMSFDDFKWQIHPWDYWRQPIHTKLPGESYDIYVPNSYANIWNAQYLRNIKSNYTFPCGRITKHEHLRDSEMIAAANNGANADDVLRGDIYGKSIAWVHKDDREKLFERACEELERRNNIQVSGTVAIRGGVPKFDGGLGWVELLDYETPDGHKKTKACVVKITLNFGTDLTMELEVGTEELRVGRKKEKDMDYDRLVSDAISRLNLGSGNGGTSSGNYNRTGYSSVTNRKGNSSDVVTYGCLQFRR